MDDGFSAYIKGEKILCTGKGGIQSMVNAKADSFQQFLLDCSPMDRWLIDTITFPSDVASCKVSILNPTR